MVGNKNNDRTAAAGFPDSADDSPVEIARGSKKRGHDETPIEAA
ncbi:hypothetical protein FRUB_00965 [Fimbriiglobus ruber]|uniref:Uncharacterized protein n=1 Tax=Fimbriiglobus ruber TaxID=1908690 RepID=A0A225EB55_9BACT|nr:hypothetical protein FRUB_00965 [Fimbriiglobus ruber]